MSEQERVGHSLEVAVDQLIYARQGEWSSIFTINRLKLRDLIVQTVRPYLAPQPSVERDHRAMEKLQRVRDWLKFAANSPGGIVAEIDAILALNARNFNDATRYREALGRLQLWIDHLWDEVNHVAPEALGPRVAQEVQMGKRIILAALEANK